MKNTISYKLLIVIITLQVSCGVKKNKSQKEVLQNVKTFNNNNIQFNYPESWRIFKTEGFEKDIILRMGPKKDISKKYMAIDELTSDGTVKTAKFISLNKNIDSIKPKYHEYINKNFIREVSFNQFNVSITKMENNNLSDMMDVRKGKIEELSNINGVIEKKSETHYINKLIISNDLNNEDSSNSKLSHIMHYYYKNGFLYILVFTTKANKINEYKDESKLIFNSFKFK